MGSSALTGCTAVAVSNNAATCTVSAASDIALLTAGSHTVNAVLTDANYTYSGSVGSVMVSTLTPSISASSSVTSSVVGQSVTFTADLSGVAMSPVAPTGTVTITATPSVGTASTVCSKLSLSISATGSSSDYASASCNSSSLSAGTYAIKAVYIGDNNFGAPIGATTGTLKVNTATPTMSLVAEVGSSVETSVSANASVTLLATVAAPNSGTTTPTGTVSFTDTTTNTPLCSATNGGAISLSGSSGTATASCVTTFSVAETHAIEAVYSADSNFSAANAWSSLVVNGLSSYTSITSLSSNAVVNQSFSATVAVCSGSSCGSAITSSSSQGTVSVTYTNTSTNVTGTLCSSVSVGISGTVTCTGTISSTGTYSINAYYSGDTVYNASDTSSESAAVTVKVSQNSVTLGLVANSSPALAGSTVTYTTTVTPAVTGTVPSGTIYYTATGFSSSNCTRTDSGLYIATLTSTGSSATSAATASCSFTYSANDYDGTETVSVTYSGDSNFSAYNSSGASLSAAVTETVENFALNFTAPSSNAVYVSQGYSNGVSSASTADVFNKTTITLTESTYQNYSDSLYPTCTVQSTGSSVATVSDPSCTVTEANGVWTVSVVASNSAAVGAYSLTVTAYDTTNSSLIHTTATPMTVYVTSLATPVFLAEGATGTVNVTFNTASAGTGASLISYSCPSILDLSTGAAATGSVSCSAATTSTGGSTTAVELAMTLNQSTAMLEQRSSTRLAALAGLPLLILVGWLGGWRKQRKNFLRYLAIVLLMVGVSYAVTGCGGGFSQTSKSGTSTLSTGSYLVEVVAKDSSGNKYYTEVPLTVNSNSVQ